MDYHIASSLSEVSRDLADVQEVEGNKNELNQSGDSGRTTAVLLVGPPTEIPVITLFFLNCVIGLSI